MSDSRQIFREKLTELSGRDVWVVSTFDHPYASPPDRVVWGHHQLHKLSLLNKGAVLPIVWDIIDVPDNGLRRLGTTLDTGLISNRDETFSFYTAGDFYPHSKPRNVDLASIKSCSLEISRAMNDLSGKDRSALIEQTGRNIDSLIKIYSGASLSETSFRFYVDVLSGLYDLMDFSGLAEFIRKESISSYHTEWLRKYLSFCVMETIGKEYGLDALSREETVFKRRLFRHNDASGLTDSELTDLKFVAAGVESGNIIYSAELFFWGLALADVRHYGNDYGFFSRLSRIEFFESTGVLQITEHNHDAYPLFSYSTPRGFRCDWKDGECNVTRTNGVKPSRAGSLTAVYVNLGERTGKVIKGILESTINRPYELEVGKIPNLDYEN